MYHTIAEFTADWTLQSQATLQVLQHLTDASLAQPVTPEGRTLGRIAWHLVTTLGEMMEKTGLTIEAPAEDVPIPAHAAEIADAYARAARSLQAQVTQWADAMLRDELPMYGQVWTRELALKVLLAHEVHHRGQMTVLMRQAGLTLPGVCGPTREDWAAMGLPVLE